MFSIKEYLINELSQLEGWHAYSAIVGLLLICGLGVPLPEDITLIAAGILSALGKVSIWGAIAVGLFGVLAGDAFLYTMGRIYGRRAFELPLIRSILTPNRLAMAERKIVRNSHFICFTARFLPGLRSPIFLLSGIMGVKPIVFYGLDGLAALISVPLLIFVGHWVGENLDLALEMAEKIQLSFAGIIVLLAGLYVGFKRWRKVRRGQRLVFYMNGRYPDQDPHLNPK